MAQKKDDESGAEKRRALRANVKKRIKGVFLKCPELSPRDIRVVNISEYGVGVDASGFVRQPKVGDVFDARLIVGYTVAPVRLNVVRASKAMTGMEIVQPSELFKGAIRTFFQPELVGAAMKTELEPASGDGILKYRFSDGENFVEVEIKSSELASLSIGILGTTIEWNEGEKLRLVQNEIEQPIDDFLRKQLVKFVQSIEKLPLEHKRLVEAVLRAQ